MLIWPPSTISPTCHTRSRIRDAYGTTRTCPRPFEWSAATLDAGQGDGTSYDRRRHKISVPVSITLSLTVLAQPSFLPWSDGAVISCRATARRW